MTEITLDHIELAILNLLAGGHPIRDDALIDAAAADAGASKARAWAALGELHDRGLVIRWDGRTARTQAGAHAAGDAR